MTKTKTLWETIYEDYNSTYLRHVADRRYHLIELTDLDDACGADNEGQPKYAVELKEVDLDMLSTEQFDSVLSSCGYGDYRERQMTPDPVLAEMCGSYGAYAPLWDDVGGNRRELIREAKRESSTLDDPTEYHNRMNRSVNGIGSTALEYMQGDLASPLARGVMSNDSKTTLVAKLYGVTADTVQSSPRSLSVNLEQIDSDDPLAFMAGYLDGRNSGVLELNREELASEYIRGYKLGTDVRVGSGTAPEWATS